LLLAKLNSVFLLRLSKLLYSRGGLSLIQLSIINLFFLFLALVIADALALFVLTLKRYLAVYTTAEAVELYFCLQFVIILLETKAHLN
jgi:hypothetical protein